MISNPFISSIPPLPLELYLESLGFEVLMIGGQCPFQIEANHRTENICIYFRARHRTASLDIFTEGISYDSFPGGENLLWSGEIQNWPEPMAGYIDYEDAFYVFAALWRDGKEFAFD